jgi:hypothetical protein
LRLWSLRLAIAIHIAALTVFAVAHVFAQKVEEATCSFGRPVMDLFPTLGHDLCFTKDYRTVRPRESHNIYWGGNHGVRPTALSILYTAHYYLEAIISFVGVSGVDDNAIAASRPLAHGRHN